MKFAVVTFGCRVNQADSLRLEEQLRARGEVLFHGFDFYRTVFPRLVPGRGTGGA